MSTKALKTLWSFFSLFSLVFSTLAFLRTRGTAPQTDVFGILGLSPAEAAALALPVQLVMMALVLWLTQVWCEANGGAGWASRLPIFYFEAADIDTGGKGGKIYQGRRCSSRSFFRSFC